MNKFKIVLNNENGSPSVETIIAITVGLGMISAMLLLGAELLKYIGKATESVVSL